MLEARTRSRTLWIAGAWLASCLVTGCAGDDDDTAENKTAILRVRIEGGVLLFGIDSVFPRWVDTCRGMAKFKTWTGTVWVAAQDDRPPADSPDPWYLDNMFVPPRDDCQDGVECIEDPTWVSPHSLAESLISIPAREYVKVGTGPMDLDEIESMPLEGRVEVTGFYYTDDKCSGAPASVSSE